MQTKAERLQELKVEEKFYKVLDRFFDAGWREYVKDIHRRNDVSNIRTFKILSQLKDVDFVRDLMKLMKLMKCEHALLNFTKKLPEKGVWLNDQRTKGIPKLYVWKYPSGQYCDCSIHIQVKENRFVYFIV